MAELKTQETDQNAVGWLNAITDEERRRDCFRLVELMQSVTGAEARMWGSSIVGFGRCHYVYASGREGDWFPIGFSPRKGDLTLYFMGGLDPHQALLKKLGKHKVGKGCVYVKRLSDIQLPILRQMLERSFQLAAKPLSHKKPAATKQTVRGARKVPTG